MLRNTFIHIPGVGTKTEQRIWESGLLSWNDWLSPEAKGLPFVSRTQFRYQLERSMEAFENKDVRFFGDMLPNKELWRLFPDFRHTTAYLDIETTGLDSRSTITTIALYDGCDIRYYVHGRNMDEFPEDIRRYRVIVTYNGRCFDVPFIRNYFGLSMGQVHIDLRYVLGSLGFRGGLKACEKRLGIDRGGLDGVDGYFAVLLWADYVRNANEKALETLLAYNIEDTINLETLMVAAFNLKLQETPFFPSRQIPESVLPEIPFRPHMPTIESIRRSFPYY